MRRRDERGAVAGAEVLALAVLVVVGGTVVLAAAWSVVETRTALDEAAREYLRAYTEQPDAPSAAAAGATAATTVLARRGTPVRSLTVAAPDPARFGPCSLARVQLRAVVPSVRLPFGRRFGATTVRAGHEELVDAHREVTVGPRFDPSATPCAGA